ncbi:hypothetical protein MGSAQ_002182, partial [marine sediment metagenome]
MESILGIFTYYYHEVVPKILKHRDELSP